MVYIVSVETDVYIYTNISLFVFELNAFDLQLSDFFFDFFGLQIFAIINN